MKLYRTGLKKKWDFEAFSFLEIVAPFQNISVVQWIPRDYLQVIQVWNNEKFIHKNNILELNQQKIT